VESYTIAQYVADIRAIASEETEDAKIGERIKPLSARLAADKSWFKDKYRKIDEEQGFGLHLLHEEDNHDLAVFVIAWGAGRGVSAHNHKTWAVVAGIEGQEHETNYERLDDHSEQGFADLKKTHAKTLYPGTAVCCLPEDIHAVFNDGQETAVSLHTYGHHLNHTGRSIFDVEAKTEKKMVVKIHE
jgi:predicted metal-dependent enzyme (double-stranded beta helix superfamily)